MPSLIALRAAADTRIDRSLIVLRDTLAHGRVLFADDAWTNLELVKFSKPVNGEVRLTVRFELTRELDSQIEIVGAALDSVLARYRQLGGA